MKAAINIAELRKNLQQKFPAAHRFQAATPLSQPTEIHPEQPLNFNPGTINEIVSKPFQGMALLIAKLLDEEREFPLALIDGRDSFDPDSYGNARCRNLLWIRCTAAEQFLQSTDILLRDGNLPLILLDLHLVPKRELSQIPDRLWQRFRTEARESGSTLAVLSCQPMVHSAHSRFFIEGSFTLDHLEKLIPTMQVRADANIRMEKNAQIS